MTPQQLLTARVYENEPSNWSQTPQTGVETDPPTSYQASESNLVEEDPINCAQQMQDVFYSHPSTAILCNVLLPKWRSWSR